MTPPLLICQIRFACGCTSPVLLHVTGNADPLVRDGTVEKLLEDLAGHLCFRCCRKAKRLVEGG